MSHSKTPDETATDVALDLALRGSIAFCGLDRLPTAPEVDRAVMVAAIEADRKQRDLYEPLAEALEDRVEGLHDDEYPAATERRKRAAERLRTWNGADTTWCDFIGPTLDAMEAEHGR